MYSAATELQIPVFTFVRRDVLEDHRVYQKNKPNTDKIIFPSVEEQKVAKNIFEFINEIKIAKVNNGFFPFEYTKDIENLLRKQWAGMFFDFLQNRSLSDQYESQNKILTTLSIASGKLEELVKSLYLQIGETKAEAVIEEVDNKSMAEQMFLAVFDNTRTVGFLNTPIKELLRLSVDQPWYDFFGKTQDFHLTLQIKDSKGNRFDVITSNTTRNLIAFRGPSIDQGLMNKIEQGWNAFKKLNEKQRAEILSKFVVTNVTR